MAGCQDRSALGCKEGFVGRLETSKGPLAGSPGAAGGIRGGGVLPGKKCQNLGPGCGVCVICTCAVCARVCACVACVRCVVCLCMCCVVGGWYVCGSVGCVCVCAHRKSPGVHEGIAFSRGSGDSRGEHLSLASQGPGGDRPVCSQGSPLTPAPPPASVEHSTC